MKLVICWHGWVLSRGNRQSCNDIWASSNCWNQVKKLKGCYWSSAMYVNQSECYLIRIMSVVSLKHCLLKGSVFKCRCTMRHGKHFSVAGRKEHPFWIAQSWESGSTAELSEQVQRLDGLVRWTKCSIFKCSQP